MHAIDNIGTTTSTQREYCTTTNGGGAWRRDGFSPEVFLVRTSTPTTVARGWTGPRGGEDRSFQHCTLCSALPKPPGLVGTGISSAAAHWGHAFPVLLLGRQDRRSWWSAAVTAALLQPPWVPSLQWWGQAFPAWLPTLGRRSQLCRAPWGPVAPVGRGDRTGAPSAVR